MPKTPEEIADSIMNERHSAMDEDKAREMYIRWIKEYGEAVKSGLVAYHEGHPPKSLEEKKHTR